MTNTFNNLHVTKLTYEVLGDPDQSLQTVSQRQNSSLVIPPSSNPHSRPSLWQRSSCVTNPYPVIAQRMVTMSEQFLEEFKYVSLLLGPWDIACEKGGCFGVCTQISLTLIIIVIPR